MQQIRLNFQHSAQHEHTTTHITVENETETWGLYIKEQELANGNSMIGKQFVCNFHIIAWLVEGEAVITCGEEDYMLTHQKVICIRSGIPMRWKNWSDARVVCFIIPESFYRQLTIPLTLYFNEHIFSTVVEKFFTNTHSDARLSNIVLQMEFDRRHCKSKQHRQMLLISQLAYLLERIAEMNSADEQRNKDNKLNQRENKLYTDFVYMVENHYNRHWSMTTYAKQLNVCKRLLYNSVKKATGLSPFEIVNNRMYIEFLRLTADGNIDRETLTSHLGFNSYAAFRRWLTSRSIYGSLLM